MSTAQTAAGGAGISISISIEFRPILERQRDDARDKLGRITLTPRSAG